jgi:hypothetical protein
MVKNDIEPMFRAIWQWLASCPLNFKNVLLFFCDFNLTSAFLCREKKYSPKNSVPIKYLSSIICRVYNDLYRVSEILDKEGESGSN